MRVPVLPVDVVQKAPPLPAQTMFGGMYSSQWIDAFRSQRPPSQTDLMAEWKDAAYCCATLNADGVARGKLKLYVRTGAGQRRPRMATRSLTSRERAVRKAMGQDDRGVEEVQEHPVLDLLQSPTVDDDGVQQLSRYNFLALTQLYLETAGLAYWLIEQGGLGVPGNAWILPTHLVDAYRSVGSRRAADYYQYSADGATIRYSPTEIVPFTTQNLLDPYTGGWSPMQAAWQRVKVMAQYMAHGQAFLENNARPDAIISSASADMPIGRDESRRLEQEFVRRFGKGGVGGVWVSPDALRLEPISWPAKDTAELTQVELCLKMTARVFGVPLAMLDKDANRANADAARQQHAKDAIWPRMQRMADTLTQRLIPMYDDSRRLFFEFESPVTDDEAQEEAFWAAQVADGRKTINEYRTYCGLPEVAWGDEPWLSTSLKQPSQSAEMDQLAKQQQEQSLSQGGERFEMEKQAAQQGAADEEERRAVAAKAWRDAY